MAISSLPNKYGVGDFGPQSYKFIDYLKKANMKIWQILPLNPVGYGNSPYQSYSSYAMDEIYISLDLLKHDGLITSELIPFNDKKTFVDYDGCRKYKRKYLLEAFENFKKDSHYNKFCKEQFWLDSWAYFMASKRLNGLCIWYDFVNKPNNVQLEFERFLQYILYKQWNLLKTHANKCGIKIMGDLPIYVGLDSEDVYSNPKVFLLDEDKRPKFVAGVPPDYFSPTGQRWGNPIYDWDYLEKTSFKFLKDRIEQNSKVFDIIRIDHFRAFDTYWKINAECDTAIDGEWCEAPGYKFFNYLFKVLPNVNIVVEDLGDIRKEVIDLKDYYKFKGMKVTEFHLTFDPLFSKDKKDLIIYTGTHDNATLKGWFYNLSKTNQRKISKELNKNGFNYGRTLDNLIYYTFSSGACLAIIPMQDVLLLDNKYRMNTPSTSGFPNWTFRLINYRNFAKRIPFLQHLIKTTKR